MVRDVKFLEHSCGLSPLIAEGLAALERGYRELDECCGFRMMH